MIDGLSEVDFKAEHVELLDLRDIERESHDSLTEEQLFKRMDGLDRGSMWAKTFVYNGRLICCAGLVELHPGVVEAWILPSKYIGKDMAIAKIFCQSMKENADRLMQVHGVVRLQANCVDEEVSRGWLEWMGLEKEGVLRKFGHNGRDYCMYARIER